MLRSVALAGLLLAVGPAPGLAQYRADAAGAPPAEAGLAIRQALETNGFKISRGDQPYCEIWFRNNPPSGGGEGAPNATISSIREGALVGVIRFDADGLDRRGQTIRPGVYTLRYARMPMNRDHEGAAPQRDFLLLVPSASDRDPDTTPGFDALVDLSQKATLTRHPAVLSLWKSASDTAGFSQRGEDWVLEAELGDTPIALIVVGTANS